MFALLAFVELAYAFGDGGQCLFHLFLVPSGFQFLQVFFLFQADGSVVHFEDVDRIFMVQTVFVHTHDGLCAGVDTGLRTGCGLFDTHLGQTGFDGFGHTAQFLDFLNVFPSLVDEFVRQGFHIVRTGPRVDVLAHLGFVLDVYLSVTRDTGREVRRQGDGFVQ